MRIYVAYGSNLNKAQMAFRCPTAKLIGTGELINWELIYRGSRTGFYATIRRKQGSIVPVALWSIQQEDERSLDRYEGYPRFYQKHMINVQVGLGRIKGMVYTMDRSAVVGKPSDYYVDTLVQGYKDCNLDMRYLEASLNLNKKELKKRG